MNWQEKKFGSNCIINLPGDIFEEDKIEALKGHLQELAENDCKTFFLDLGQVAKLNSKGLGQILSLYKFAFYNEVGIKLYNLQPYVSQLIYQTRMNIIFDICNCDEIPMIQSQKSKAALSA